MESLSVQHQSRYQWLMMETLPRLKPYGILLPFSPLRSTSIIPPRPPSSSSSFNAGFHRKSGFNHVTIPLVKLGRRTVVARSELAISGSPEESTTITTTETQLSSRIRGVCFYAMTAAAAIPLFAAMVAAHPFVILFDRHRRRMHHLIAKVWATVTIVPFYRFEFEGLENLPAGDAAAVYVSNHQSFLDIYTLLTLGRCFKFISKTAIFVLPIVGWAMFLMGLIPLRRMDSRSQLDCLKRCMDLVRKGASVFFFPEGTRSKDGKLGMFKKGAFSIAAKTGVPVVPITLMGTGQLMPPGKERIVNTGSVKVVVHKPVEGTDADLLCKQARSIIADNLLLHGYGVHDCD